MSDTNKPGLFYTLAANPGDLCSWAALHDLLADEGEPDVVLRVCRQAGTWIGSREDWEREGPVVVDRVPVARVWVQDMAPKWHVRRNVFSWWHLSAGYVGTLPAEVVDSEDVFPWWQATQPLDPDRVEHQSLAAAQAWLTQIALEYVRRVRDERKKGEEQ